MTRTLFHHRRRTWPKWLALAILLAVAALYWLLGAYGSVIVGFFAKGLCSSVFVAQREPDTVVKEDLLIYWPQALFAAVDWQVDRARSQVHAALPLGLASADAVYRAGAGCAVRGAQSSEPADDSEFQRYMQARAASSPASTQSLWPAGEQLSGESLPASVRDRLMLALDRGFAERSEHAATPARRTRAIVVVYKGQIVAERYAAGFDASTPLAGWSMAKSVTAAWLAALPDLAGTKPDDKIGLRAWSAANDPRAALTFRHALNMTTGLDASENYASPFSDVNRMLFVAGDSGGYSATRPLLAEPGKVFNYSSGTTNLISLAIRERLGADYALSPYRQLLDRIGMRSAVIEQDITGTYVGSSYLYATARDWARFGLLFLRDGVWNSERILPVGWVAFSSQRSAASHRYGAHWWLDESSEAATEATRQGPQNALPTDLYQATGHAGQRLTLMPSQDLVIVRLGQTLQAAALRHGELIRDVIAALQP